jgi:hypothetical protein
MTALAWLLVLWSPASLDVRCDRFKVFYNPRTWR